MYVQVSRPALPRHRVSVKPFAEVFFIPALAPPAPLLRASSETEVARSARNVASRCALTAPPWSIPHSSTTTPMSVREIDRPGHLIVEFQVGRA
ncbi:hypothetical protein PG997_010358 [Apiospora hydei]|uniref:Uncharacterized protein n=1 Tax=Apiospora hydei TaxID=1337664 RepID=A0ABR1VZV6_9PEZI